MCLVCLYAKRYHTKALVFLIHEQKPQKRKKTTINIHNPNKVNQPKQQYSCLLHGKFIKSFVKSTAKSKKQQNNKKQQKQ